MESNIANVKSSLGADLANVKTKLSEEISLMAAVVDRAVRPGPSASAGGPPALPIWQPGGGVDRPYGHGSASQHQGNGCAFGTPPPVTGMNPDRTLNPTLNYGVNLAHIDSNSSAPHVELPQFDGSNAKLWQQRCEEYFQRWGTPQDCWISYGSSQFSGAAATWLEAFLNNSPRATWIEFVQAIQARFVRNQYQVLLRRLYHIGQTGTIEDYVQRFSGLVDLLSAYDTHPDPLNFLTRFLDGLKPGIRVLVALQQPSDLDSAFTMALLYEELGEGCPPWNTHANSSSTVRRSHSVLPAPTPPPPPPARWVSKSVEEK
uniref:Uncharacterized protein n=1 Tax=Avena sativa TaxID=4498 RepID=A0ACD5WZI1_AVESA